MAQLGASCDLAASGREAIAALRENPGRYSLVLVDLGMPDMDGIQTARSIRGELGLAALPLVALSADAQATTRATAAASGMNDFLVKPLDLATLRSCLQRHVQDESSASAGSGARASDDISPPWPTIEGIDGREARELLQNDVELFELLLLRLATEYQELTCAVARPEGLRELAAGMHRLQGSAGQLGAVTITRLARAIEEACLAQDSDSVAPMLAELDAMLKLVARTVGKR